MASVNVAGRKEPFAWLTHALSNTDLAVFIVAALIATAADQRILDGESTGSDVPGRAPSSITVIHSHPLA